MATKKTKRSTQKATNDVLVNNVVALDELISVMSLLDYPLSFLPQAVGGKAKHRFDKFGQVKLIIYQDVLTIIELYSKFMEEGKFIILDERVVDRHGLQFVFENVLKKDDIQKILSGNKDAVKVFKSCASDSQKATIVGMMTRMLAEDHKAIDLNVVDEISRFTEVDIMENASDMKKLHTREE